MIKWKEQSEDDFIAIEGDYMLRVEQMDIGFWWWCVYFKDEQIDTGNHEFSTTCVFNAEDAMYKHLKLK